MNTKANFVATGVIGILAFIGWALWELMPQIIPIIPDFVPWNSCKDMYLTTYYKDADDGKPTVTWKICLKGTAELSGTLTDITGNTAGNKGTIRGFSQDDAVTLAYRSSDPKRPSYGYYILKAVLPRSQQDAEAYAGIMVMNACDHGSDKPIVCNEPMQVCPAIMSQRQDPEDDLKAMFFQKPCQDVEAIWPNTPEAVAAKVGPGSSKSGSSK